MGDQSDMALANEIDDTVPTAALLQASLEAALSREPGRLVLAVSGGRDSIALMHAVARWAPARLAAVATFDHGTGAYATDAAALVVAESRRLGLTIVHERARTPAHTEAAWRAARWQFLHRVAHAFDARVATAHTRDDQVETIVMRLLRGTGARGMAALASPSGVVRPWLSVSRAEVAAWVSAESLAFMDDPMNATRVFLRGRVRHDLLPAFELRAPGFAAAMVTLGERAAVWRREVEAFVDSLGLSDVRAGVARVPVEPFLGTTAAGRAVLWPACLARIGVILDARGTRELVRFSMSTRRGAHVVLAGGAVVMRIGNATQESFELRRPSLSASDPWDWTGESAHVPRRLGRWRVSRLTVPDAQAAADDPSVFSIPANVVVTIRSWRAGDRIQTPGHPAGRRVTRYFSDARVPVLDRSGWPIVLAGDELQCVPGLCRSLAAPNRPGWLDSIWYRCEREPDGHESEHRHSG